MEVSFREVLLEYNVTCTFAATIAGAQKILEKVLKKGYICCHIQKVLVTGAVTKLHSNIVSLEKNLLVFAAVLHWQGLKFKL